MSWILVVCWCYILDRFRCDKFNYWQLNRWINSYMSTLCEFHMWMNNNWVKDIPRICQIKWALYYGASPYTSFHLLKCLSIFSFLHLSHLIKHRYNVFQWSLHQWTSNFSTSITFSLKKLQLRKSNQCVCGYNTFGNIKFVQMILCFNSLNHHLHVHSTIPK